MNALELVVLSFAVFFVAQRFYARWLERKVYETDSDEPTPAHTKADGIDFVSCNKHVLFGHLTIICGMLPAVLIIGKKGR